jgi:DNA-binding SARP family transcriptional activator
MELAAQLEIAAHSLTAVLGLWVGLTVATRAAGSPSNRVFALLALALAAWSTSIIVQRLPTDDEARRVAHAIEELTAALAIAGTAHFSLSIATEGLPSRRQTWVIAAVYVSNLAFALPGILDPTTPVALAPPHLALGPIPGGVLGLAWVGVRLATLALGAWWLLRASRRAEAGTLRRRQLRATLVTIVAGGVGASLRFLPGIGEADAWIGVSFVTLAIVLATYAVFSAGIFFGPAVAGRAFATSIVGGFVLFGVVAGLFAIEAASQAATGIDLPLFTALALVVAAAVYEPVAARLRDRLAGTGSSRAARDRMLRAIGAPGQLVRPAEAGVGPALARLAEAIEVDGLAVVRPDGSIIATHGAGAARTAMLPIPLVADGAVLGELRVGARTDGAPLRPHDEELVRLSAAYVAAALRTGLAEAAQAASLVELALERAAVDQQATALHAALVAHDEAPAGLVVHALGPMRVERAGQAIDRWGGDKAGSRQAQAIFAFLFDRAERGVAKDEVLELVWPDTDLERADLAFHRTMVGLRRTVDPRGGGRASAAIRFGNDRYRLDPSFIAWSDVAAFEGLLASARAAGSDLRTRVGVLEEARGLVRGEYLDDCPFYGDSAEVEERRDALRRAHADLLVALGEAYEADGDRMAAADAYREALRVEPDAAGPAGTGLERLGAAG